MIDAIWVWGAFGLILLSLELAIGTFEVFWFGVAAVCVAIAMWIFPNMPQATQFIMFALISLSALTIWRLYYKKNETHSRVGQAQGQEIGRVGTVIAACGPNQSGKIRFVQGLMGDREWSAVSNEVINAGTEAEVIAVEGNALRIKAV